jgi:GDPmannose 4,6-dehydratase
VPIALITGINGQDGSYLAELLIEQGYKVVGTVRKGSDRTRIDQLPNSVEIIESHLKGCTSIENLFRQVRPDEVYNLAARASSKELWAEPVETGEVNGLMVVRLLDAIYRENPKTRFAQASSSEIFGDSSEKPQTESTPLSPRNPYGAAKAIGHWMTCLYRKQKGLFACSCILYNHESPRRRQELVTRKISQGVAKIKLGLADHLPLGDLDARRDWGYAGDYVRAMWLALQHREADDYIIASGDTHSVREFCELAFSHVGLRYTDYVTHDRQSFRSPEGGLLVGNPEKAKQILGWHPTVSFADLVVMMVDADLAALQTTHRRR